MQIEFFAEDPRRKARPALEQIMRNGTDQLVIACAFCTAAGVELLCQNASRLKNPDSFVVVSVSPPIVEAPRVTPAPSQPQAAQPWWRSAPKVENESVPNRKQ